MNNKTKQLDTYQEVKKQECAHEYRTFLDRVDKSREIWCIKCGKDYPGAYSKKC